MGKNKVILITGASSGIGAVTASLLTKSGLEVFGTSRNPDKTEFNGYKMLKLDVNSDESVNDCIQEVIDQAGRIDVLINNAGYELVGGIEETSIDEAKSVFETNYFGSVRMIKAALPFMRKQQSGQIINNGSLTGLLALPFLGYYSSTKWALEGLSEVLRYEVKKFNIKVSIVEPSFFKSNLAQSAQVCSGKISDYSRMRLQVFGFFKQSDEESEDPLLVAKIFQKIINNPNPKLRYRVGKEAVWRPRMKAVLSPSMFEFVARKAFRLDM